MDNEQQKKVKAFLARRHPEYEMMLPHWEFMKACYDGGRSWFEGNIFKYIKEGETEYADRVNRAYRFNHTREVVDLVDKYLFKMEVHRNLDDAPEYLKRFWSNASRNRLTIDDLMKQVSKRCSIYGRTWMVVDTNNSGQALTVADEKKLGIRVFAYNVTPEHVPNMSYDDEQILNWILIHEQIRDDDDPMESSGEEVHRFRLWTRNDWTLFTLRSNGKKTSKNLSSKELASAIVKAFKGDALKISRIAIKEPEVLDLEGYDIEVVGPNEHKLGVVPVFACDNVISDEPYSSTAMIDDVAYLDRAIANYLSNLDAIIQDQTYSQLTMPAQGLLPGEEGYDAIVNMGTKRIFTYDAQGGGKPEYISPDAAQAEIVLKVINKIINEIYHSVGLAGERTKQDNALGIDNSSGVAKAYDFERVNSLLASKADSLELIENNLVRLVALWNGEVLPDETRMVEYPGDFDVRGLYDEFEIALNLSKISAPDSVRRKQMEQVIDKLFPQLGKDLKEKMMKELEEWPPELPDLSIDGSGVDTNNVDTSASDNSAQPAGSTAE